MSTMRVDKYSNEEDWLDDRRGRVTGTRAKDLISARGGRKIGFYEIIAERVATPPSSENPMARGVRLEEFAIERFAKETGKKVDSSLVIWSRDDDSNIAISPDGSTGKTGGVEVKCLSSARHIEAWLTKKIPAEYKYQAIQYFVVNDKLKVLYFVFYDPRMPVDFFFLELRRVDVENEIQVSLGAQRDALEEIDKITKALTF